MSRRRGVVAAAGGSAETVLWSDVFDNLAPNEGLDGTSADVGGVWSATSNFRGCGQWVPSTAGLGVIAGTNGYNEYALLDAGFPLLGRNLAGSVVVVGGDSSAGRGYTQAIMGEGINYFDTGIQNACVGIYTEDGRLIIRIVTDTDGFRTVSGSVPSPDLAVNGEELTWTYDGATHEIVLTSSYDSISTTLSANEQSDLAAVSGMGIGFTRARWWDSHYWVRAEMREV